MLEVENVNQELVTVLLLSEVTDYESGNGVDALEVHLVDNLLSIGLVLHL